MKKIISASPIAAITLLILLAGSCVTPQTTGKNELTKRYFDAWIQIHHPGINPTPLGSVIISDTPGSGETLGDSETTPYVYCTYKSTDLEGNIQLYTDEATAKQLGTYAVSTYYGPQVLNRNASSVSGGLDEILQTMSVGGTRTAVIPGWLLSSERYDTAEEYLENCSGSDAIWTLTVHEAIPDVVQWEIDSISRYISRHHPGLDSTSFGYYYIQTQEPLDTTSFEGGDEVYINYTGRLLNGRVFDSTIADTTKKYRIYSASKDYGPLQVTLPESGSETVTITSSSSSTVQGFGKAVSSMKAGEKGICILYSGLGYGESSTTVMIPPYSPLIFELHMLGKNEDGSIDDDELDKD